MGADGNAGKEGKFAPDALQYPSPAIFPTPALIDCLPHNLSVVANAMRNRLPSLSFSQLGLWEVPPDLLSITTLRALDLSHNAFGSLPEDVPDGTHVGQ